MRISHPLPLLCLRVALCCTFAAPAFADISASATAYFPADYVNYTPANNIVNFGQDGQFSLLYALPQFNPALGQLQDITVSETFSISGQLTADDAGFGAATFYLSPNIQVYVNVPGATDFAYFNPPAGPTLFLETPSSVTQAYGYSDSESSGLFDSVSGNVASLAPFIGTGSLDLNVNVTPFSYINIYRDGLTTDRIDEEHLNVSVTYDYSAVAPEPSYLAATAVLFGLLAWRRLRRKRLASID